MAWASATSTPATASRAARVARRRQSRGRVDLLGVAPAHGGRGPARMTGARGTTGNERWGGLAGRVPVAAAGRASTGLGASSRQSPGKTPAIHRQSTRACASGGRGGPRTRPSATERGGAIDAEGWFVDPCPESRPAGVALAPAASSRRRGLGGFPAEAPQRQQAGGDPPEGEHGEVTPEQ